MQKKTLRVKLLCKKIKSHTGLEISSLRTTLTRAYLKPKNAEEERKLIENGTPKPTIPLKKYSLKTVFWNDRMVGKPISRVLDPCLFTAGKS